jgi:hypothetical protein
VSEFGIERARELAAQSHAMAREALAEVSARAPNATARSTCELERIADFIYTRTS